MLQSHSPLLTRFAALCAALLLTGSVSVQAQQRQIYQWRDQEGVANWADRDPQTDPTRLTPRPVERTGTRAPVLDAEAVGTSLREYAARAVPLLCQQRNPDNPAQRSACEHVQQRSVNQVSMYLKHSDNRNLKFIFDRCQQKWLLADSTDFVSFAQCLGLKG